MQDTLLLLPPKRQNIYKFYGLELQDDGTTLQNKHGRTVFHPILSAYLVLDFINQYRHDPQPRFLEIARKIADRALALAEPFTNDSLVFWYDPETKLSNVPRRFFSGLTQSWFVRAFARLFRFFPEYKPTVQRFFNSLLIPVAEGGVLLDTGFGWVIEEYPHEPAFYTLNGWLSALRFILEDKVLIRRAGCPIDVFIQRNLDAAQTLLPRYDLPHLCNTRYQLAGFTRVKLAFALWAGRYEITSYALRIPGEGVVAGELQPAAEGRWKNFVERQDGRTVLLNGVFSMISGDDPNVVELGIGVEKDTSFKAFVAEGDYDPLVTGMRTERWRALGEFRLKAGHNRTDIPVPLPPDTIVAYPTNFLKKIHGPAGRNYNAYHFLHIMDLAILYKHSGRAAFKEYAQKWLAYVGRWPSLPWLSDPTLSHSHFSNDSFERSVGKLLAGRPIAML